MPKSPLWEQGVVETEAALAPRSFQSTLGRLQTAGGDEAAPSGWSLNSGPLSLEAPQDWRQF